MSNRSAASELPDDLPWANTQEKPKLGNCAGRVVLLYFWSYSSIHSVQALADLRQLEAKYHDGLVVLGFHCPKFAQEQATSSVLKAVNRHGIRHPVANDSGFRCWQLFNVQAWPTYVLIDAESNVAAMLIGEDQRANLDQLIAQLLDEAVSKDIRIYESASPVARAEPKLPLLFPTRVLASDSAIYIADTGHHRVLECNHDGKILRQFGSNNPGFWDGRGNDVGFFGPQGMALFKDILYVADSGNHAIRRVKLINGEVDTIAGTGHAGRNARIDQSDARAVALNCPVDLTVVGDRLFIAMAGSHQIWLLDLGRQTLSVFAGSGQYGFSDGAGVQCDFSKPFAIASQTQALYVADADASAIRTVRYIDNQVRTVIGSGLYEFGDEDGNNDKAQLQHPAAIAFDSTGTILWIVDSFNNKIKAMSVRGGGVRALALAHRFHEPSGICLNGKSMWIANTNAHEIVRVDLGTGRINRLPVGE